MGLKSNEIDPLLIRQLKQTANKPVTRLVLLIGFNTFTFAVLNILIKI